MESKVLINTLGYIIKEEDLVSVKNNIIPNTLVLETQKPFPGYHGSHQPEELKIPEFIYFVTKEKYSSEHIFRVTDNVQKYFGKDLNVARVELTIFNDTYYSFRIKGCKDYTRVNELQSCFKSEGIKFANYKKIETKALIRVQKTFSLEEQDLIYVDLEDPSCFYLPIPLKLNWEQFRIITMNIKNNIEDNNYDAALALFFLKHKVVDLVRIFTQEPNIDKLLDIKTRYQNEIKKLLIDKLI